MLTWAPIIFEHIVFYSTPVAKAQIIPTKLRNYCMVWTILCLAVVMLGQQNYRNMLTFSEHLAAWAMHISEYNLDGF